MSVFALLSDTIGHSVYAAGAADVYGNPAETWTAPVDVRARVQPAGVGEDRDDRTVQEVDLQIYLEPSVVVSGRDRFEVGGETFEVVGAGERWTSPNGRLDYVAVNLRRVEGS